MKFTNNPNTNNPNTNNPNTNNPNTNNPNTNIFNQYVIYTVPPKNDSKMKQMASLLSNRLYTL